MPDGLYERDTLAWSEVQGNLLRRLAAGERVNDAIDWANVIEEVHDVGVSQMRACVSLWQQAMLHLLKMHTWPDSSGKAHWRQEAGAFLDEASLFYSPSMRQKIDLAALYGRALRRLTELADEMGPGNSVPNACPFSIDLLVAGDTNALLAIIGSTAHGD